MDRLRRRPDLARRFKVVRAPALLVIDATGQVVWRQDDVVSDTRVFDLAQAEAWLSRISKEVMP